MEFLAFTSVTLDELQQLIPSFEAAFQSRMAVWRMDGKPRTARRFTVYKTCPLPTPEDRLFFLLTYLQTSALQVVHGRLRQASVAWLGTVRAASLPTVHGSPHGSPAVPPTSTGPPGGWEARPVPPLGGERPRHPVGAGEGGRGGSEPRAPRAEPSRQASSRAGARRGVPWPCASRASSRSAQTISASPSTR